MAHSSSYQEFKAGGYVAYFALEGERAAAGKAGSDSDTSESWPRFFLCNICHGLALEGERAAAGKAGSDSDTSESRPRFLLLA